MSTSEPAPKPAGRIGRMNASARTQIDSAQAWAERTIFWRVWERLLENEFVDRSVALAGKAFVSLFPAIVVIIAFAPKAVQSSISSTITHRMGLSGPGLNSVKGALADASDIRRATGFAGLIFTFFYINSFTTALGRVYIKAWRRPPSKKLAGYALGASWLIGLVAFAALIGLARRALAGGFEDAFFGIFAGCGSIGLWWLTAWVMLDRRVRWRPLLATAVMTGVAMTVYAASASIWMPRTMSSNQKQFGYFGVTLSLVTWLTGVGMIIVIAACAGAELAEDPGALGRLVRGDNDELLVPGAPPSLPPPLRGFSLADAIGRGNEQDGEPS